MFKQNCNSIKYTTTIWLINIIKSKIHTFIHFKLKHFFPKL